MPTPDNNDDAGTSLSDGDAIQGDVRHLSKHRLIWGIGTQSLAIIVRVVQQIAFVPILIGAWGVDLYQDWIVVFSAVNLLSMTDLGMQLYFGNYMLAAWSQQDYSKFNRIIGVGLFLYICILSVVVFLLIGLKIIFSPASFMATQFMSANMLAATATVLALAVLSSVPLGLYTAIYRARGNYGLSVGITVLAETARGIGVCTVVLLGGGPLSAALVYLVVGGVIWSILAVDQKYRYGVFPLHVRIPTYQELRNAVVSSILYGTHFIINPLITSIPILILNYYDPLPSTVVLFSVTRTITGLVRQIIIQPNLTVGMEMARLLSVDDILGAQSVFINAARLSSALAGLLAGITLFLADGFIRIWTHGAVQYNQTLGLILLISIVANVPGWISYNIFQFTNRPTVIAIANTIYAAGTVILCISFAKDASVNGVAVAVGLAEFLSICILVSIAACRIMKIAIGRYMLECFGMGGVTFAVSYCVSWAIGMVVQNNTLSGIIFTGALWTIGFALPCVLVALHLLRSLPFGGVGPESLK